MPTKPLIDRRLTRGGGDALPVPDPAAEAGTPHREAAPTVWLARDEAGLATGQFIAVDGGLTAASPRNPEVFR